MGTSLKILLAFSTLLLAILTKCQSDIAEGSSRTMVPGSTTTSIMPVPSTISSASASSASSPLSTSSSLSPLDDQIAHLKAEERADLKKNNFQTKMDELPLVYEDGDIPTTDEPLGDDSTTPMMRRQTMEEDEKQKEEETSSKQSRQTQDEILPNPGQIADPSLVPVQMARPDYRPLLVGVPVGPPPPTEMAPSETVMGMTDEEAIGDTTEAPPPEETEETTTTTTEAPPAEDANEAATEAAEAQAEAATKQAEAAAATKEAAAAQEEAAAATQEAAVATQEANAAEAEAASTTTEAQPEEVSQKAENAGTKVAEAVPEGGGDAEAEDDDDDDDDDQEAIDALTEALQNAKVLVQNITILMPRDSPSMQAFLGSLLAQRPALLTQNPQEKQQQQQQPQPQAFAMPTMVPIASAVMPSPFLPVRPSPIPPSMALYDPNLITPSSSSSIGTSPSISMPQNYVFPPPPSAASSASSPQQPQQRPPRPSYLVEVEQLHSWIKSGRPVTILDASYEPEPGQPDHIRFYADYYAKWDKLLKDKKGRQYERSHIPGAVPFNLNIATYPSWNERQALYPPERFQEYIRRLGIDQREQLVIYARGPLGGMLHAARAWFMFRIYGHENVTVLNGGLDAWRRADLPANDQPVGTTLQLGNWTAKFRPELVVTFEELTSTDTDGYCILSRINWYNLLDARPRNEFFGMSGTVNSLQFMAGGGQRSRLAGAKPFPADELIQPADGLMVTPVEILRRLQQIGYVRRPTIVLGNSPDEASLALLALAQVGDTRARLYNGGMEEIRRRASYLITAKRRR